MEIRLYVTSTIKFNCISEKTFISLIYNILKFKQITRR